MDDSPQILAETPEWLVLDKPAGWHCVAGRTAATAEGTGVIESWLRAHRADCAVLEEAGLVHRLDRDTSGCLVVATNESSRRRLRDRFSSLSDLRKVYLVRCASGLEDAGACTLYFSSRRTSSPKVTVRARGESHESGRFRWRVLARGRSGDVVEVELMGPGRRHQIRAGLAHLGFPIAGDVRYGGPAEEALALHAWRIDLDDQRVEAPIPSRIAPQEIRARILDSR